MIKKVHQKLNKVILDNRGTTLVEMLVCFVLLGIFLIAASMFITNIADLFYRMKGETYSRQVSDIILEKVASEIDGAEYGDASISDPRIAADYSYIDVYDKTDTHVKVNFEKDESGKGEIKINYYPINRQETSENREGTVWTFDESVYYGFQIEDMKIVRADQLASLTETSSFKLSDYGLTKPGADAYPSNVLVIFLHMKHPRYEEYYTYRFVKMYNVPDNYVWPNNLEP